MTQGERLARIETLLEGTAVQLDHMADDIKAIRKDLRSKGAGILIGVAVAAGGLGASASSILGWLATAAK
jgi:hypothetical protein